MTLDPIKILVVEDEEAKRITMGDDLREAGYFVRQAACAEDGLEMLSEQPADIIITDLKMPGMNGMDFLRRVKSLHPSTFIVVITGYGTVETAVEALREGAYDYLTKPFPNRKLLITIKRIEDLLRLRHENATLKQRLFNNQERAVMVGRSSTILQLREQIQLLAQTDSPVLITGETGTGKDMAARVIHNLGPRHKEPFIKVSCAMYPVNILESELFGYEKGAFTGAGQTRQGRFEAAGQGTVYLDEVDDIPLDLQVKLLHVLEDKIIERVGGSSRIPFTARVIVASKQDLGELVEQGRFRKDLFFRIKVLPLHLPPLRDFTEDLPYLITHFLYTFGHPTEALSFSESALDCLQNYFWPGNVRELRNLVERLLYLDRKQTITEMDLAPLLTEETSGPPADTGLSLDEMVHRYEKKIIQSALHEGGGNKSQAARQLNIKLSTFRDRLKKHGLD